MTAPVPGKAGLDFFLPTQTRKWLALLEPDSRCGFRIRTNLDLPAGELGFSFRSNALGLRGPAAVGGGGVCLGTSFAMGFTVDNGENWYEQCLLPQEWLNLGLPVGEGQLESLLELHYEGAAETALVVYHPNFWYYAQRYAGWATSGQDVFSYFRWQTDPAACEKLEQSMLMMRRMKAAKGLALECRLDGLDYYLETALWNFDFRAGAEFAERAAGTWRRMLSRFKRCLVVRFPIKQEVWPSEGRNQALRATLDNYAEGWSRFAGAMSALPNTDCVECPGFGLGDYFPLDGHWNATGNARFAAFVRDNLGPHRT
jgi:hypothetical protein